MPADYENAIDVWNATLQHLMTEMPALECFAYNKYQLFNLFFKNAKQIKGGDQLEGHITLTSEGNADFVGVWDQDDLSKSNIDTKYTLDWRQAKGGMLWNLMETSLNSGKERIFDVLKQQYKAAIVDIIDKVYLGMLTGQTSATDVTSPYSIFSWLPWGTAASTGGWTGYSGHYNDGNGASAATFNRGGVASSSSSNAKWASYSADHQGNLDDTLYGILDDAVRKQNFQAPTTPMKLDTGISDINYSMHTSNAVLNALNSYNAKSDDQMGFRVSSHYGTPSFRMIPFGYCDKFDDANTSVYGTNPIVGLNHSNIYPVIHNAWNFKEYETRDPNRAVVLQKLIYLRFNIWCEDPYRAGFTITQIPT
jgi:hypothetical protein